MGGGRKMSPFDPPPPQPPPRPYPRRPPVSPPTIIPVPNPGPLNNKLNYTGLLAKNEASETTEFAELFSENPES